MISKPVESILAKVLSVASGAAAFLAFTEGFVQLLGTSLIDRQYAPSRILEISALLALLAILIMVKQIRDRLDQSG